MRYKYLFSFILAGLAFFCLVPGALAQGPITRTISTSTDDAEQMNSSSYYSSSDLELTYDHGGGSQQTIGLRFTNITIPADATITNAYIQFTDEGANEAGSTGAITITVEGESSSDAVTFSSASNNITDRTRTNSSHTWQPEDWTGEAGQSNELHRTGNLSNIVQEIIGLGGWSSGNAIAFIITGEGPGVRTAYSYDGSATHAAVLYIEWSTATPATICTSTTITETIDSAAEIDALDIRYENSICVDGPIFDTSHYNSPPGSLYCRTSKADGEDPAPGIVYFLWPVTVISDTIDFEILFWQGKRGLIFSQEVYACAMYDDGDTACSTWDKGHDEWSTMRISRASWPTKTIVSVGAKVWFSEGSGEFFWLDRLVIHDGGCITPESPEARECDTVKNPDFVSGDDWKIIQELGQDLTPAVSESAVQIFKNTTIIQEIDSISETYEYYTVTVRAKAIDDNYNYRGLIVGVGSSYTQVRQYHVNDFVTLGTEFHNEGRLHLFSVITSTEYSWYTATVTGPLLGSEKWLLMSGGGLFGDDVLDHVLVDFICIEAGGAASVCIDPQLSEFTLNTGQNYGGGLFGDPKYGTAQGWRGVLYDDLAGGPASGDSYLATFGTIDAQNPAANVGLYATNSLLGFGVGDSMAVEYLDSVILAGVTVRVVYPADVDPDIKLWIDSGSGAGWVENQTISPNYDEIETAINAYHSIATVSLTPTGFISGPVKIGLSLEIAVSGWSFFEHIAFGFDQVDVSACFPGDPLTGADCVVLDPDLDEDNGLPSFFYWGGSYEGAESHANLTVGEVLFQNVTPARAGTYDLNMLASGYYDGGPSCGMTLEIKDYESTLILSALDIPCKIGLVQTYTMQIDLPLAPVEILLRQNSGSLSVDYFCLSLPGEPDCLNPNPIFRDGIFGYSGDFTIANGQAVIEPGASLAAFAVNYGDETAVYQLELISMPDNDPVDVRIIDAGTPSLETPGTIISSTTAITHIIGSEIFASGAGPVVWDWNTYSGDLAISQYCITQIMSGTTWYGGKDCATLVNADFTDEATGWTTNNITQVGGWVIFGTGGGSVGQEITALSPATQTITATLHWIAAGATSAADGVAVIDSDAGVFTVTKSFGASVAGDESFDVVSVAGDVDISISGPAGFQLDYACLLPGEYTKSGEGGSGGPVGANCAPPPKMILTGTLSAWLPSIWIWSGEASNLETISAYSAAWLRYIACLIEDLVLMLETKLDEMLLWLKILTLLQAIDTVASTITAVIDALDLLEQTIDDLVDTLTGPVATAAYIISVVALFLAALAALIALIIGLIALLWAIPSEFWTNFTDALNGNEAILLPFPTDENHPLYAVVYGVQVINQTIGATILFPITIVAISIGSIQILLWTLKRFFRVRL